MSAKIDVVLLQQVKSLGNKNDVVSVSVAYAKNVLFPKGLAKTADMAAKNAIAQKKDQDKKHHDHLSEIRDKLVLYVQAKEPLTIKRKVTPSGSLYEKVHEHHVRDALTQRTIHLPADIALQKSTRDSVGGHSLVASREKKKVTISFSIVESYT